MNSPDGGALRSRPAGETGNGAERQLSPAEKAVVVEVLSGIRRLRHGVIQLSIQDGKVVQIETTEKKRL